MVAFSIIKALSGGQWLMEPNAALAFRPLVNKLINGEKVDFAANTTETEDGKKLKQSAKAVPFTASTVEPKWQSLDKASPGSVSVIPLKGVVMQDDYCGAPGLKTIRSWMNDAEKNSNIVGQIIYIDSPGGSAQGVNEFSQFIKSLSKPVVAYIDDMACSGGYWIASACTEIICADKHSVLGSIGAFSTFYDDSKAMEKHGYREIQVYAPQCGKKNKIFRDIVSPDAETSASGKAEYASRFLAPLVEDFHATVKQNRAATASKFTDAVLQGDIFNGTESVNNGLADTIGNFNYALTRVRTLSKSNQS